MEPGRYKFGGATIGEKVTATEEELYNSNKKSGSGEYSRQHYRLYQINLILVFLLQRRATFLMGRFASLNTSISDAKAQIYATPRKQPQSLR